MKVRSLNRRRVWQEQQNAIFEFTTMSRGLSTVQFGLLLAALVACAHSGTSIFVIFESLIATTVNNFFKYFINNWSWIDHCFFFFLASLKEPEFQCREEDCVLPEQCDYPINYNVDNNLCRKSGTTCCSVCEYTHTIKKIKKAFWLRNWKKK